MARETARAIALKMGNTLVAPILNYSPNEADPELPGTIGLTNEIFAAVNERIAEQLPDARVGGLAGGAFVKTARLQLHQFRFFAHGRQSERPD